MQLDEIPHMGLDATIGLHIDSIDHERVTGSFPVTPEVLGPDGGLHRGVLSSTVESLASIAAAAYVGDTGRVVGVANSTSYFATTSSGTVTAVAEPVSLQPERQEWAVRVTDAGGLLLAQGNVQLVRVGHAEHGGSE
jgi:1,4-dihydroxy-2-naphthoyl-CoA hydrolase